MFAWPMYVGLATGVLVAALVALAFKFSTKRLGLSEKTADGCAVWVGGLVGFPLAIWLALHLAAPSWRPISSSGGRFSIEFPYTPSDIDQTSGTRRLLGLRAANPEGNWQFSVTYVDIEREALARLTPEASYDQSREEILATSAGFRLLAERKIVLADGVVGRELRVSNDRAVLVRRGFLAGSRLYQLMILYPPREGDRDLEKRFFESFTLTKN